MSYFGDIRATLRPPPGSPLGPLPPLLIGLTIVTGLVDAFSYLVLGHVFVANMTGNVVFLGFALAGAPGFSLAASALALVAFFSGAYAGGALVPSLGKHRGRLVAATAAIETALLLVSVALTAASASPPTSGYRYPLIALMSVAMGLQNATARHINIPGLTTTVLTLTLVGAATDTAGAGRGTVSVLSMFTGAVVGATLLIHVRIVLPLVCADVLLVAIAGAATILGRSSPSWVSA